MNYYNEISPYSAAWLRNLIGRRLIPAGEVDERDIRDVRPDELRGFVQCHFFAGIAGWPKALQLAGWPSDRPVWTGSCPCQPFSAAGRRAGFADERHLWPAFHHLIRECRPAVVFGEQVAAPAGYAWLDLVQSDLEASRYAVGAAVLPAAGVGAPHGRHRIWWMANAAQGGRPEGPGPHGRAERARHRPDDDRRLGDPAVDGRQQGRASAREDVRLPGAAGPHDVLANAECSGREGGGERPSGPKADLSSPNGLSGGFWTDTDWLPHTDGKRRPVEPGTFPLAHGVPGRVGQLGAYGNAIVPQAAAEFIGAYDDYLNQGD